jgi:hypothetical protein
MKIITTVGICLCIFSNVFSQMKLDYDHDSKWFWGMNLGGTWHTTDVNNLTSAGYGLTLGHAFNYNYGKIISFDIQARYLRGYWIGQDYDSSGFQDGNKALSTSPTNYKDNVGFAVNNFRADLHQLSLELVLHAHSIRERTGIDPYVFGGVGFSWNKSYGNLLNVTETGSDIYAYDTLPEINKASIDAVLDESYEVALDGSKQGEYTATFMPSLGFGLAYQVGKRFSIGVEHKTTFTMADNFDGVVNPNSKYQTDLFHYTSMFLRFQIGKNKSRGTSGASTPPIAPPPKKEKDNYTTRTLVPPIVTFTDPASTITVAQPNYLLRADVNYVSGRDNIVFKHNNANNINYTFTQSNSAFVSNIVLVEGQNIFELTGKNTDGVDTETITIWYKVDRGAPPVVNLINPATNPGTVSTMNFNFSGKVYNVQAKNQVTLSFNGQNWTNFSFNPNTAEVLAALTLKQGSNVITLSGKNSLGSDSKTTLIKYEVNAPPCYQPSVSLVYPSKNITEYNKGTIDFIANVSQVSGTNQIQVKVNGSIQTQGNYNATTKQFKAGLILSEGTNTIELIAQNNCGTANVVVGVTYKKDIKPEPCDTPTVQITTPDDKTKETTKITQAVNASTTFVTSLDQIQMRLNGVLQNGGQFNASNQRYANALSLVEGTNTIEITTTNRCGYANDIVQINYTKPCDKPVISLSKEMIKNTSRTESELKFEANISKIEHVSQLELVLNGVIQSAGTFNATNQSFSKTVKLQEGANTIELTATNDCGMASETSYFSLSTPRREPCNKPEINVLSRKLTDLILTDVHVSVSAIVNNIYVQGQIELKSNGVVQKGGSLDLNSHVYTHAVILSEGENEVLITATNECGTETKLIKITVQTPLPCLKPEINILGSLLTNTIVVDKNVTLSANLLHVENVNQIQVKVNGAIEAGGSFNVRAHLLTKTLVLSEGENTVEISATNTCGTNSKLLNITVKSARPCEKPEIKILNEIELNSVLVDANLNLSANILHVDSKAQIQVYFNGQVQTGGMFNAVTHLYTNPLILVEGENEVKIRATNECGTVTDLITVNFKPIIPTLFPPIIAFINIPTCPMEIKPGGVKVIGTILQITTENQAAIELNNKLIGGVSYTPIRGGFQFEFQLNSRGGEREFNLEVLATNDAGSVTKSCLLILKEETGGNEKITICHTPPGSPDNSQTIEIPLSAWPAHLAHGDSKGECVPRNPGDDGKDNEGSGNGNENTKITICHTPPGNPDNPQTIEIPLSAWPAHKAHGDKEGTCKQTNTGVKITPPPVIKPKKPVRSPVKKPTPVVKKPTTTTGKAKTVSTSKGDTLKKTEVTLKKKVPVIKKTPIAPLKEKKEGEGKTIEPPKPPSPLTPKSTGGGGE